MAIPAKVVVKPRASVTAGFAKDVDAVNVRFTSNSGHFFGTIETTSY
jgi:hypothetical protein